MLPAIYTGPKKSEEIPLPPPGFSAQGPACIFSRILGVGAIHRSPLHYLIYNSLVPRYYLPVWKPRHSTLVVGIHPYE